MGDKRKDYISWDEYFMGVAKLSGMRSKDPNTQVGCCIVSQDNKILSMGYNGLPTGCSDDDPCDWQDRRLTGALRLFDGLRPEASSSPW